MFKGLGLGFKGLGIKGTGFQGLGFIRFGYEVGFVVGCIALPAGLEKLRKPSSSTP